jgi:hypothetical protein
MRACLGLTISAVLGLVNLAQAGPFDAKQVPADAKWGAHLDVDALMASSSMKKVQAQIMKEHPDAESALAMIRTLWRFDPRTDLHGITVFGTQLKKDTGVAIVHAKVDQKFLLEMVKLAPEYQASTHGKFDLHSWKHGKKRENAAFFKPDVMVFGGSPDELKAALDVLDGTKPSLAQKTEGHPMDIPPGTILAAGVHGLSESDLPCESPLLKQADAAMVFAGEREGNVFVQGVLKVKQDDVAAKIENVAKGILAFASLAKLDDPDATKLIDAVKVRLSDKAVSIDAQAPVDALWAQIQKEHAKQKAEKKAHGHGQIMEDLHGALQKHLHGQ